MKLLGIPAGERWEQRNFTAGSTDGSEATVLRRRFLSLLDIDIKPCIGCKVCLAEIKGKEACVIKDDAVFVWNKIMDCDGLILKRSRVCLTPPGYLLRDQEIDYLPRSLMSPG